MFNKKNKILIMTILLTTSFLTPTYSSSAEEKEGTYQRENVQVTTSEYAAMFQSVFQYVLDNYVDEIPKDQLFQGAMKGMFDSLGDPHSTFLTQAQILDLTDTTEGEFGGLGIHIQKIPLDSDPEGKSKELPYVKIISPIHGTPAFKAGLKSGDYITKIEDESTVDLTSDDVLDRLRGEPGSKVTISILRNRVVNFDVTITRAIIEIPTEKHAIIDGIGYLKISQFTHHSASQVKEVLEEFNREGIKGLIIDVRNNPGGLLNGVVDIADFIFSDGVIVSTKSRINSENNQFKATRGTVVPKNLPIVVLINNGSASASEILTGAIKDRERGTVIGTKSFGKGSVQQMRMFGDGGFKMTVARFYSPNDITIDKVGIEPHIEVKEATLRDLTEEETLEYIRLLEEKIIGNYIIENKNITENMIETLVNSITQDGYNIPKEFLMNDIRYRVNRSKDNPPVYDLINDKPLIKALEIIRK